MSRQDHQRGFTLVELLIATSILALVLVLLTSVIGGVSKVWSTGEQQVSSFQDGRAVLDVVAREFAQAEISARLQFVTNPAVLDAYGVSLVRTNSDSVFWQAVLPYRVAGSATPKTALCEIGYYIDPAYNLKRFFVSPADTANYQVISTAPSDTSANWVTNYARANGVSNTIATGVVALWIRCLDTNGDLIPWISTTQIHYNSASHFRPAILGTANSFQYNDNTTAPSHLLPNAVEITLVTVDANTLRKGLTIPGMPKDASDASSPSVTDPSGVPTAVTYFNNKIIGNRISTARTFTAQIYLPSAIRQ